MSDDHLKNKIRTKLCWRASLSALSMLALVSSVWAAPLWAAPQGGRITRGDGHIEQRGTHTDIHQQSDFLATRWNSFNIGAHESARAHQPNATSRLLIRVDGGMTNIAGSYISNGITIIENQNGVQFSRGAIVNVGGLLATSSRISGVAGNNWQLNGIGGPVVNHGKITAGAGGVVLAAVKVHNTGDIISRGGDVALGAGSSFTVDFAGGLVGFEVEGAALGADVTTSGKIEAQGGIVKLSAQEAQNVRANVVSVGGVVKATQIERRGGVVYLSGGAQGIAAVSGSVQAGDKIETTGKYIAVKEGATLKAPEILVGGDFQGRGDVPTAQRTLVEAGALLDAGRNGRVIVWADETTWFHGGINAPKGFVEVSGKLNLAAVNLPGINVGSGDDAGTLLLDPDYIIIGSAGADITESIVFTAPPVNETNTLSADSVNRFTGNLTLQAGIAIAVDAPINKLSGDLSLSANTQLRLNNHITLGTGRLTLTGGPGLHGVSLGGDIQLAGAGVVITGGIDETGTTISPFGVGGNNSLTIMSQSDITLHSNIDLGSGALSLNAGLSDAGDDGNVINGGAVVLVAGIVNLTQDAQFGINAPFTLTAPTLTLTSRSAQTVRAWMTQGNPNLTLTSTGVLMIGANIDNGSGNLTLNGASINLSRNIELSGKTVALTGAIGSMTPANFNLTITASKALKLSADINLGSGDLNVMAPMIKVSSLRTLTANLIDIKFTGAGITTLEHGIAASFDNPNTEPLNEFVSGKDLLVYAGTTIFEFAAINEMCAVSCTLDSTNGSLDANKITATGDVTLDAGTSPLTFTGTGPIMITANNIEVVAAQLDLGTRALMLNASVNFSDGGNLTLNAEIIGAGNDGAVQLSAEGNLAINRDILLGGASSDGSSEGFGRALTLRGGNVIVGGSGERQVRGGSVSLTASRSSGQHTAALKMEAFTGDLTLLGSLDFGTKSLTLLAMSDDGDILFDTNNPTTLIGGDIMLQSSGAQAATHQDLTITAGGLLTLNQDIDVGGARLELSARSFSLSGELTLTAAHVLLGQANAFTRPLFTVETDHLIIRTEADQEIQPWMIEEHDRSLFVTTAGNLIVGRDINLAADISLQGAMISFTGSREISGQNVLLASASLDRPVPRGVMSSDKDLTIHASGIFTLRSDIHLGSGDLNVMAQRIKISSPDTRTLTANLIDIKFTGAGITTLEHGIAVSLDNPNTEPLNEFVSGKDLMVYAGATVFEFAAINEMCAVSCTLDSTKGSLDANKITATGSVTLDAGTSPLTFTGTGPIMIAANNIEVVAAQLDLGTRALLLNASINSSGGGNLTLNAEISGAGNDGAVMLSASGNLAINRDILLGGASSDGSSEGFGRALTLRGGNVIVGGSGERQVRGGSVSLTASRSSRQHTAALKMEAFTGDLTLLGSLDFGTKSLTLLAMSDDGDILFDTNNPTTLIGGDIMLQSSGAQAATHQNLTITAGGLLTLNQDIDVGGGRLELSARSFSLSGELTLTAAHVLLGQANAFTRPLFTVETDHLIIRTEADQEIQPWMIEEHDRSLFVTTAGNLIVGRDINLAADINLQGAMISFTGPREISGQNVLLASASLDRPAPSGVMSSDKDLTIHASGIFTLLSDIHLGSGDLNVMAQRIKVSSLRTLTANLIDIKFTGAGITTLEHGIAASFDNPNTEPLNEFVSGKDLMVYAGATIFEFAAINEMCAVSCTLNATKGSFDANKITATGDVTLDVGTDNLTFTGTGAVMITANNIEVSAAQIDPGTIDLGTRVLMLNASINSSGGGNLTLNAEIIGGGDDGAVMLSASGNLAINQDIDVGSGTLELSARSFSLSGEPTLTASRVLLEQASSFSRLIFAVEADHLTLKTEADHEIQPWMIDDRDRSLSVITTGNLIVGRDINLAADISLQGAMISFIGHREISGHDVLLTSTSSANPAPSDADLTLLAQRDLTIAASLNAGSGGLRLAARRLQDQQPDQPSAIIFTRDAELLGRLIILNSEEAITTDNHDLTIRARVQLSVISNRGINAGTGDLILATGRSTLSLDPNQTLTAANITLEQNEHFGQRAPVKFAFTTASSRLSLLSRSSVAQTLHAWMAAPNRSLTLRSRGHIFLDEFSVFNFGTGSLTLDAGFDSDFIRGIRFSSRARTEITAANITLIAAHTFSTVMQDVVLTARGALNVLTPIQTNRALALTGNTIFFGGPSTSRLYIEGGQITLVAKTITALPNRRSVHIKSRGSLNITGGLNADEGTLRLIAGYGEGTGAINFIGGATALKGRNVILIADLAPRAGNQDLIIRAERNINVRADIDLGAGNLTLRAALSDPTGAINFNQARQTGLKGGNISLSSAAQSHEVNQRVVIAALDDLTVNSSLNAGRRGALVLLAGTRSGAGVGRLSLATLSAVELIGGLIQLEGQQAPLSGMHGLKIVSFGNIRIHTDLALARDARTILHLEAGYGGGSGEVQFLGTRTAAATRIFLRQYGVVFGAHPPKALAADELRFDIFSSDDQSYYPWMGSVRGQDLYLRANGNIILSSDIALGTGDLTLSAGRAIIFPSRTAVLSGGDIMLIAERPIVTHDHHLSVNASRSLTVYANIDTGAGDLTLRGETISFGSRGRSMAPILDIAGAHITIDAARAPSISLDRAVRIHASGNLQIHGGLNTGTGNLLLLAGSRSSRGALNFASAAELSGADIFLSSNVSPRASEHELTVIAGNHLYIRTDINTGAGALILTARAGAINFGTSRATALTGGAITLTAARGPLVSNPALTITTLLGPLNLNTDINNGTGDLTLTSAAAINFNPARATRLIGGHVSLTAARDSLVSHHRFRIDAHQDITINANLDAGRGNLILLSRGGAINFVSTRNIVLRGANVALRAAAPSLTSPKSLAITAMRNITIYTDLNTGIGALTLIAGRSDRSGALRFNDARATTLTGGTITLTSPQGGANEQNLTLNASVDLKLSANLNVGRAILKLSAGREIIFPQTLTGRRIVLTKGGLPFASELGVKFASADALMVQVAINYTGTGTQILHDWMAADRQTMRVSVNGILAVSGNFDAGDGDIFLSAKGGIHFTGNVNLRGHHIELVSLLAPPPGQNFLDVGAAGNLTLTGQFNSGSGFMRVEAGMGEDTGAINFGTAGATELRGANIALIADRAPLASNQNLTIISARDLNIRTDINIGTGALVFTAAMGDREGLINFNTARATTLTAAAITLTTPLADGTTSLTQAAQPVATRQNLTLVAGGDVHIGANLNLGAGDLDIRAAGNLLFYRMPRVIADRILLIQNRIFSGGGPLAAAFMTARRVELIITNSAPQSLNMITFPESVAFILRVGGDLNIRGDITLGSARSLTLEAGYGARIGAINFISDATLTARRITLLADGAPAKNNNMAVTLAAERNLHIGASLDTGARALTLTAGGAIYFTALRPITLSGGAIMLKASARPAPSHQSLTITARNNLLLNASIDIGAGDLALSADEVVSFSGTHFMGARSITLSQSGQVWGDNPFTVGIDAALASISLSTDQISFIYAGSSDDQRVQDWMIGSVGAANVFIRSAGDLTAATHLDLGERDLTLEAGRGDRTGALVLAAHGGKIVLRARHITLSADKAPPSLHAGSFVIRAAQNLTVSGQFAVNGNLIFAAGAELSFGIGERPAPTGIATVIKGVNIRLLAGVPSTLVSGQNLTFMASGDLNIGADINAGAGDLFLNAGMGTDIGAINITDTKGGARAITLKGHHITLASQTAPRPGNGQSLSITASGNLIINAGINLIAAAASAHSDELKLSVTGSGQLSGDGTLTASTIHFAQMTAFSSVNSFGGDIRLNGGAIRFSSQGSFSIHPWMIALASNAHLDIHAAGDLAVAVDNITLAANQDLTLSAGGALNFRTVGATRLEAHNIILAAAAAPVASGQALILEALGDINLEADLDTGAAALTLISAGVIHFTATAGGTRALTLKGGVITLTASGTPALGTPAAGTPATFLMGGQNLTITAARDLNIRTDIHTGAGALTLTAGDGETSGAINFGGERQLTGRTITLAADMAPSASHHTLILTALEDINIGASLNAGRGSILFSAGRSNLTGALNFTAAVSLRGYKIRLRTDGTAPVAGHNFDVTVDAAENINIHTDLNTGTGNLTLRAGVSIKFQGAHAAFVKGGTVSLTGASSKIVDKNITITAMDNLILNAALNTSGDIRLTSINGIITTRRNLTARVIGFTQGQAFGGQNPFGTAELISGRIVFITTSARAQNVYDWMAGLADGELVIRAASDIIVNGSIDLGGRVLVLHAGRGDGTGAINWSTTQDIELTADAITLIADQAPPPLAGVNQRLTITANRLTLRADIDVGTSDLTINVDLLELSLTRAMALSADNITVNAARVRGSQGQDLTIQARRDLTVAAPLDVGGGALFLEAGDDVGEGVIIFPDPSLTLTAANIALKQDRTPFGGDKIAPVTLAYTDGLTINYDGRADQTVQVWMRRLHLNKDLTLISRGSLSIQNNIKVGLYDLTLISGGAINFADTRDILLLGNNITITSGTTAPTAPSNRNLTINADGDIVVNASINLGSSLLTMIAGGDISGNGAGTLTAAGIRLSQNEAFAQTAPFALAAGALAIEAHTAQTLEPWMIIADTHLNFMSTGDIQIAGDYDLGAGDLTLTALGALNPTAMTRLQGNHISLNAAHASSSRDHGLTLIARGDLNINHDIHLGTGDLKLTGGAIRFSPDRPISLMGGEIILTGQTAPMAKHQDLFIAATTLTLAQGTALNVGAAMLVLDLAAPMLGSAALTARRFDLNFFCASENCMAYMPVIAPFAAP